MIRGGSSSRSNTEQILAEVADEAKTAFNAELDFFSGVPITRVTNFLAL